MDTFNVQYNCNVVPLYCFSLNDIIFLCDCYLLKRFLPSKITTWYRCNADNFVTLLATSLLLQLLRKLQKKLVDMFRRSPKNFFVALKKIQTDGNRYGTRAWCCVSGCSCRVSSSAGVKKRHSQYLPVKKSARFSSLVCHRAARKHCGKNSTAGRIRSHEPLAMSRFFGMFYGDTEYAQADIFGGRCPSATGYSRTPCISTGV